MGMKSEFDILFGSNVKNIKTLKKRYKELVKQYHPDVKGDSVMFRRIQKIYEHYKEIFENMIIIKYTFDDIVNDVKYQLRDILQIEFNNKNIKKRILDVKHDGKQYKIKLKYKDKETHPIKIINDTVFVNDYMKIKPEDFRTRYLNYDVGIKRYKVIVPEKGELCFYIPIKPKVWIKLNYEVERN